MFISKLLANLNLPFPRLSSLDDDVVHAAAGTAQHGLDLGVGLSKDGLVEAAANPPSQPDTNPYDDIRRFDTDPFQPGIQLADPIHADLPLDVTHLTGSGDALPDALPDAFPDAGFGDVLP